MEECLPMDVATSPGRTAFRVTGNCDAGEFSLPDGRASAFQTGKAAVFNCPNVRISWQPQEKKAEVNHKLVQDGFGNVRACGERDVQLSRQTMVNQPQVWEIGRTWIYSRLRPSSLCADREDGCRSDAISSSDCV